MAINPTQITPPRVAFIDPRSGAISREWYRFFLSLWTATGNTQTNIETYPATDAALASYEAMLNSLAQEVGVVPAYSSVDINAALQPFAQNPDAVSELMSYAAQLQKQIQALQLTVAESNKLEVDKQLQALAAAPIITPQIDAKRYGSFYDLNDQTAAAINTAYAMSFSNTQYSRGVTLGSPSSQIYVDRPTIYNIQFSAQLDKTSASLGNVWIWLDLNGSTVLDTATQVSLQGSNAATVAAWNFLMEMNAGDYFRLMWATDDTNCYIKHDVASTPVPAIPSIILTVTDNIK